MQGRVDSVVSSYATTSSHMGIMQIARIGSALLASLLIVGCASGDVNESLRRRSQLQYSSSRAFSAGTLSMLLPPRLDSYTIGPEDVLEVSVMNLLELGKSHSETVWVDLEGRVSLPLVGPLPAAGRTPTELRREITERLGAFLNTPQVAIHVKEYRSKRVGVLGAVNQPGVVYLRTNTTTVVEALALGGGANERVGRHAVLARTARGGELPLTIEVDLEALGGGDLSQNFTIYPGDVLHVAPAERFYVSGYVLKPGEYPLARTITASEAIAAAGGLVSPDASPDITVIRRFGEPPIEIDLTMVAQGLAEDPILQPADVLEVRQGFWWGLGLGLYRFVKGGIGFGYNLASGIPPLF